MASTLPGSRRVADRAGGASIAFAWRGVAPLIACPTLDELPPPPNGKTGWPWTEQSIPFQFNAESDFFPSITIVIPTFNHGRFIEETIRSVLLQSYPKLELIIMDGGSSDDTVEIIKRYEAWTTHWQSAPDGGQVDAILNGFKRASGEILNWLNSDDFLLPNALDFVASMRNVVPDAELFVGARIQITEQGIAFRVQDSFSESKDLFLLGIPDFPQESTFFTSGLYNKIGLDRRLNYVFDTAFHWRALVNSKVVACSRMPLSKFRVYPAMKTLRVDGKKTAEFHVFRRDYVKPYFLKLVFIWLHQKGILAPLAKLLARLAVDRRVVEVLYDPSLMKCRLQEHF